MTAQKHTPGPWEYRENCIYPTSRQRCIARLDWHIRDEVDDANARLIAAAPDMLEALYEAEEYFDNRADADHDETGFVPNEEMKLLAVVRAAIAKATGQ